MRRGRESDGHRPAVVAIVAGNRRVQGVTRLAGTVAGDVAKSAPCDVLVASTCNAS